jgi:thiol-disulfide isomerase/thioredoxin
MKMKLKELVVLLLVIIAGCNLTHKKNETKFSLNGRLLGQDTGIIILRYFPESTWKYDTASIINGRFRFQGEVFEPTRATLLYEKQRVEFYLESGKLNITLDKENLTNFEILGSKTQIEEDIIKEMFKPVYENIESWRHKRNIVSDSIKNMKDEIKKSQLQLELEDIEKQLILTRKQLDQTSLKFVLKNPQSYVSPYYLSILVGNNILSLDSMHLAYNLLDTTIQKSKYGLLIKEKITKKENTRIGAIAPDFKAYNINNDIVTLSEFKDKSIVLLDFWASWCVPCRESIPYLKSLYKEYHSEGLEIISVSTDVDKDAWLLAIKEEGIDIWHNITTDDIDHNYDVGAIPAYLLIDKNGRIVGHWEGLTKENEKSLNDQIAAILK